MISIDYFLAKWEEERARLYKCLAHEEAEISRYERKENANKYAIEARRNFIFEIQEFVLATENLLKEQSQSVTSKTNTRGNAPHYPLSFKEHIKSIGENAWDRYVEGERAKHLQLIKQKWEDHY